MTFLVLTSAADMTVSYTVRAGPAGKEKAR